MSRARRSRDEGDAGGGPTTGSPAQIQPPSETTPARPPEPAGRCASGVGVGCVDEVWWRRLAQPAPHRWDEAAAVPRRQDLTRAQGDPDPNALACDGLLGRGLRPQAAQRWLRRGAGRPVSAVTTDVLAWCCDRLAEQGLTALLRLGDPASCHTSHAVRSWIRLPHQQVQTSPGGVRIVASWLPVKRPWLTPMEPKWGDGKRAVSDPDRLLSVAALATRVCTY